MGRGWLDGFIDMQGMRLTRLDSAFASMIDSRVFNGI